MLLFKVPEEDNQWPQNSIASSSRNMSVASETTHDGGGNELDPAVKEAISAIKSSATSRTRIKNIPRGVLLSACSSFRITAAGEPLLDSLKKGDILSMVHDWVCV